MRKPKLLSKDATSLSFLASTITSVAQMDAVVDLAAEVFDVATSALHVAQESGVVTLSKNPDVSAETS